MARVVFVDDEEDLCELFLECYESPQYELEVFSDAFSAIESINQKKADLLVLDYRMKGINAFEFLAKLNEQTKYCIVSGELDLEVKDTQHKCFGVISKPANNEDVLKIFKNAGIISE